MQIAKKSVEGTLITFDWADGSKSEVDVASFAASVVERAIAHGFSQKLGDSYSGAAGDVSAAKAMFNDTLAALQDGDWNRAGGGFSSGGVWVEALAQASGETMEAALKAWNDMDDDTKKATRKHPQVKLAKAEIEMERAKAKAAEAPTITL